MEILTAYLPMDRRQSLATGESLPETMNGAGLFADISGFTPLTEALVNTLGPQRGAEELTRHLNLVYDALITELHRYGGSVITFSGDAITCWLEGDDGRRATRCALDMQEAMQAFSSVTLPSGGTVSLAVKIAIAVGKAHRFTVGDPQIQLMDVLAGETLYRLAAAEHHAERGEVILDESALAALGEDAHVTEWRTDPEHQRNLGIVQALNHQVAPRPWPPLPADAIGKARLRPWLLPQVYERLEAGQGEFLAELRPAVALFLRFGGIDYDHDPDARSKLNEFIVQVQNILIRYDSLPLQVTIGDKGSYLYAVFGAPVAHEDDADRAASAALELRSLVPGYTYASILERTFPLPPLPYLTPLQIGLSHGRMRTGAYGGTLRRTYGALGDEVNLAARLMQHAQPGQILVSKHVHDLTGGQFTWRSLPPVRVKGKKFPIAIRALEGIRTRRIAHFQAVDYPLPMVGREAQLAQISEKIAQVALGRGQIVHITGEAGIGKSRLAAEVVRLAEGRHFVILGGEGQSYGTNTNYLPWQNVWREFFGLEASRPITEQIRILEARLAEMDETLVQRLPLLRPVLGIPIPDNDLTRSLDAKHRKTSLEALLVECLRHRPQEDPLLIILEDSHWIDALSADLLEVIGRGLVHLPLMLVVVSRPQAPRLESLHLNRLPHFTEIRLQEFTPDEARQLIMLKLIQFHGPRAAAPPETFIQRIVERAEGNPFYIEELLNYLHERGLRPNDGEALSQLDLPDSLHSLVLSRVDQLTESQKSTLKVASVIGRLFHAVWLWGAYPTLGDRQRILADLEAVTKMSLIVPESVDPELIYLFKHIITQEVAYESLPYATRAMLHERIGDYIEKAYPDSEEQFVNLLAYHYERSENEAKKREYLLKAGDHARATYANEAAIGYYQRALPLLAGAAKIQVMLNLGQVLERIGEWQEANDLYHQAREIAEELRAAHSLAECYTAIGELLRKQGEYDQAATHLQRAQFGFEEVGDQAGVGKVLHAAGTLAAQQGEFDSAISRYQESLVIRRQLDDKPHIAALLNNLAIIARLRGDLAQASDLYAEAASLWRELGDKWAIAIALNNMGNLAIDRGDYAQAQQQLEEAVALQRSVGDKWFIANSLNNLGNALRAQGNYEQARQMYRESLEINRELGDKRALAYLLEDIGVLDGREGNAIRAWKLIGAARRLRDDIGAPLSEAEQRKLDRRLEPIRSALDESSQEAALEDGRRLSLEEAVRLAMA